MTYKKLSLVVFLSTLVMISFFTFSNSFPNQFQLAHSQQQTSIEVDPKDKQAWVDKGDALNRNGNFSEAITAYNKALETDPYYVNALDGKGWSIVTSIAIYLIWTLATYLLEGRINLLQKPDPLGRFTYTVIANIAIGTVIAIWTI